MTPEALEAHIEALVDQAPPLSASQRARIASMFGLAYRPPPPADSAPTETPLERERRRRAAALAEAKRRSNELFLCAVCRAPESAHSDLILDSHEWEPCADLLEAVTVAESGE